MKEKCQVDIYVDEGNWSGSCLVAELWYSGARGSQQAGDVIVLQRGTFALGRV